MESIDFTRLGKAELERECAKLSTQVLKLQAQLEHDEQQSTTLSAAGRQWIEKLEKAQLQKMLQRMASVNCDLARLTAISES